MGGVPAHIPGKLAEFSIAMLLRLMAVVETKSSQNCGLLCWTSLSASRHAGVHQARILLQYVAPLHIYPINWHRLWLLCDRLL